MKLRISLVYIGSKMPFTPFHLGIALLLVGLFYRRLDALGVLVGSVVLDIWPFFVLFLGLPYSLHGFSHSFLIAVAVSIVLAFVRIKFKFIKTKLSFLATFFSFLIGTFSHVLLDAPLYSDMVPFWPFTFNPFLGWYSYNLSVWFSIVCFVIGGVLLLLRFIGKRKHY